VRQSKSSPKRKRLKKVTKSGAKPVIATDISGDPLGYCSNPKVHPLLKAYFGYCLYKAALRLRSDMNTALQKHGLIVPQSGMLRLLENLGPMSQAELGTQMEIDKATMVKLIDSLENQKLITRTSSPSDRRVNLLEITKKGQQILSQAAEARLQIEEVFLEPLTSEEKRVLREAIPKLLRV
jgi:DNA-binding MarR family transcriptional regulator